MRAVAIGLAIAAIVVACARAPAPTAQPHQPSAHDQIEQLAADIHAKQTSAGLGTAQARGVLPTVAAACARSETDRCKHVCTLSDSICDDAKKICDLAAGMPGDAWAQDKCDSARASCSAAQKACCDC